MDTEGKTESEKMNQAIATAYDVHSKILEEIAGDHFHIGFNESSTIIPGSDVHSAQTRTIEAALRFATASGNPAPPSSANVYALTAEITKCNSVLCTAKLFTGWRCPLSFDS